MRLITPVPPADRSGNDYRYQPARPLSRITLQEFKALDDNYGDDPVGCTLAGTDPLLGRYDDELAATTRAGFFVTPLDQLLADHPFPPAAAHEARSAKA
jgi:membrane protein